MENIKFEDIWFPFINFQVVYKFSFKNNTKAPKQIYSQFRGALGKALKQISCALRSIKSCLECKLNLSCPYGYLFETVRPPYVDKLKKYPYLPHPFSFYIPYPIPENDELKVNFLLVGKGINFFPHIMLALEIMSENFYTKKFEKFQIVKIIDPINNVDLQKTNKINFPKPIDYQNLKLSYLQNLSFLKIKIISPLELKFQGKYVSPQIFDFSILIRNLLRRITALAYFHCDKAINLEFKNIIKESQTIKTLHKNLILLKLKRKSHRTGQIHPLYGIIGETSFEGNLAPFYPLLLLGSFVQVGKHTSFGFGKYQIEI